MTDPAGPLPLSERAAAPDLARGVMLLLIAIANVRAFVDVPVTGLRGYPDPDAMTTLDRVVAGVTLLLVDGRAYPLFGLLFGYGLGQLAARRAAAGLPAEEVVAVLRRRALVLVALGAVHGLLLFPGEILGAYGVLLLVTADAVVAAPAQALLAWSACATAVMALLLTGTGTFGAAPSTGPTSWFQALARHPEEWLAGGVVANLLGVAVTVPLGVLAARAGLLDAPERHLRLLGAVGAGGLVLGTPAGAWYALVGSGVLPPPGTGVAMALLHGLGGYAAGIGYAALFGVLAGRAASRSGPGERGRAGARGVRGLGQMSMTGYVWQTVVFVVVLVPWGPLGLGAGVSTAAAAGIAAAAWLASVVLATAVAGSGRRGPLEILLRRLTYRAPSRP